MKLVIIDAQVRLMVEVEDGDDKVEIENLHNANGHGADDCQWCAFNILNRSEGPPRLISVTHVRDASEEDEATFKE